MVVVVAVAGVELQLRFLMHSKPFSVRLGSLLIGALLLPLLGVARGAEVPAKVFATPEQAVAALNEAASTTNRAALALLFGPEVGALVNPDEVQGAAELVEFAAAFREAHQLVRETDDRIVVEIGAGGWPFPIPLMKVSGGWQFDTAAGLEELLNRRVGRNELDVLRVLRACVLAQRDYASADRDGDEVREFAQRLASSPGKTDGLYWHWSVNGEISPLGPLVAYAQSEGYRGETRGRWRRPGRFTVTISSC
ncbi:MAG: DUF2950 domain-containing protein [Rhodospirillales bacterium]|nr:DUF2950 domain-containing protein [Rhodospirillales bacterium]